MKRWLVNVVALAVAVASRLAFAQEAVQDAAAGAQHPVGIEKAMPSGVVAGGWGYVYAAYAVALGGLVLYAVSLWTRRPSAQPPQGDLP